MTENIIFLKNHESETPAETLTSVSTLQLFDNQIVIKRLQKPLKKNDKKRTTY